jgi:hypothetical protein
MRNRLTRSLRTVLFLPLLGVFAACDNPVRDDDDHRDVARLELYADAGLTQRLAYTHGQGLNMHWDGSLPHLDEGEEMALYARFLTPGGHTIPLTGEFTVHAELANQQQDGVEGVPGIIAIENHGDHVDLEGLAEGETHIVFLLWHGGHADWRSPAILVGVEDH